MAKSFLESLIRDDWEIVRERNEVRDKAMAKVVKPVHVAGFNPPIPNMQNPKVARAVKKHLKKVNK